MADHGELLLQHLQQHQDQVLTKQPHTGKSLAEIEFDNLQEASKKHYLLDDRFYSAIHNRHLNRYPDVLALEHTRVHLPADDGSGRTDYINANYIQGLQETPRPQLPHAYISTQGPLQDTVIDFWRMVWTTRASVIIMMTKCAESGREKCAVYWPEVEQTTVYPAIDGSPFITVRCDYQQQLPELTIRVFSVWARDAAAKPLKVTHVHYEGWPDHGVPPSLHGVWTILQVIEQCNPSTPIITHCSAGIGRAGSLIVMHMLTKRMRQWLEDAKAGRSTRPFEINMYELVLAMRQQRPGMVMDKSQYLYLHSSLVELCRRILCK